MPFAQSGEIMLRSMSYIFWTVFLVKIMHTVPPHTCEIGSVSNDQNQDLVLPDLGQSTLPQPTPVKFGAQMGGHQFLISSSSTPHFQSFNWKQPRLCDKVHFMRRQEGPSCGSEGWHSPETQLSPHKRQQILRHLGKKRDLNIAIGVLHRFRRLYHVQILFPSFSMAPCTQSHPPLVQAPRRDLNCMLVSWGVPSLRQWFLKVIVTGPDRHFGNNQSLFFFSWGSETWVYTKSTQLSKSTNNIIYTSSPFTKWFCIKNDQHTKDTLSKTPSCFRCWYVLLIYGIMHPKYLKQLSMSAIVCIADPLPPGPSWLCDLALQYVSAEGMRSLLWVARQEMTRIS